VCGRLVVVAATADSVSHPSHDHEHHADDEKYDPNGPQKEIFSRKPAMRRTIPRMIMTFTLFRYRWTGLAG